jgi:penicillin-binding protein 1A
MRGRVIAGSFFALTLLAQACGLPNLEDYERQGQVLPQTSFLYASDGSLITELHAEQDRVVVPYAEMPQSVKDAVVAIEDRRFWTHYGVDIRAILRAAYIDATAGKIVEGGSTITQQLVKNLYVGDDETLRRKFEEAALAYQLEQQQSKQQILGRYLNTVYFGQGAYGVQAASKAYFGIDARALTLADSALLAALIAAPTYFDPFEYPGRAKRRRDEVLARMRDLGSIGASAYRRAVAQDLRLHPERSEHRYPFPYFVDYAFRWFLTTQSVDRKVFGAPCPPGTPNGSGCPQRFAKWYEGGLRITTTVSPRLQNEAEQAVDSILESQTDPFGALTAIDPRTGYVRAMVGGRGYWDRRASVGRVNLATGGSTGRQAGSSFKPFALVAALENGISPSTVFPAPSSIDIPLENGQVWPVTNAEEGGYGYLTLEQATIDSVNTVFAQLVDRLGADKVVAAARKMGIRCCTRSTQPKTPLLAVDSAVLGSNEVNTLEMASAYGTLAAGGYHVAPTPIERITDADGVVLWRAEPERKLVVDPRVVGAADEILQKVVLYGTGTAANIGRPQIGKTGTEDDFQNAWFVGAVPQLVAAVWVGFPQANIPMEPPRTPIAVYGGTWPASIWHAFMLRATNPMTPQRFPVPTPTYVQVRVDATQDPFCLPNDYTLLANVQTLTFVRGTQPERTCRTPTSPQRVIVPSVVGLLQTVAESRLRDAGFFPDASLVSSSQPVGTVIAQSPRAGTRAQQTSTITILISRASSSG